MRQHRFIFLLFLSLILSGCVIRPEQAESAASAFLRAVVNNDWPAGEALMTRKAREQASCISFVFPPPGNENRLLGYSVGKAVVSEDTASVPATLKDHNGSHAVRLKMRREDDEWRVCAITLLDVPPIGLDFNLDFEDPQWPVSETIRISKQVTGRMLTSLAQGPVGEALQQETEAYRRGYAEGYAQGRRDQGQEKPARKAK